MENIIYNPINARKNSESAVLLSSADWNAIQETLYLAEHEVAKVIKDRENDNSGWTNIDDIDWDKL